MKHIYILAISAALLLTGCSWYRAYEGQSVVKGHTFKWVRHSTETANPLGDDSSKDVSYTVTFPDGTTKTTSSYYTSSSAYAERHKLIDQWIADNAPSAPTPKPASGTTGSDTTTGEDSKGD